MSRQQNIKQGGYIKQGNGNGKSLYCKVCHDAGKEDYNKHGLKDKDGKTTCPYLLSLKCNNCKEFGHTQKYCTGRSVIGASSEDDKFCEFCYNIDKNDLFYKTHYVRKDKHDTNSEVTCPRLKTTECNYCHELGHTPVNCDRRKRPSPSTKKSSYKDELRTYDIETLDDLLKDEYDDFDKYHMEMITGQTNKEIYGAVKRKDIAEKRFMEIKKIIKEKNDTEKNDTEKNDTEKKEDSARREADERVCLKLWYAKDFIQYGVKPDDEYGVNPDDGKKLFGFNVDKDFCHEFIENHPKRCSKNCDKPETTIAEKTIEVVTPKKTSSSWATLASKKKLPIPLTRCLTTFGIQALPLPKKEAKKAKTIAKKTPVKKSWADDSDDEDETEEEEFEDQEQEQEENDIEN
jgi:hypothetical protein